MKVKVTQLCLILCDSMDCSLISIAPLSMGFSRQEYWSGLPFPSPGDLPDPGIERESPASQVDFTIRATGEGFEESESEVAQSLQTLRPHGL